MNDINTEDVTLIPKRLVEENTLGVRLWTLPSHILWFICRKWKN